MSTITVRHPHHVKKPLIAALGAVLALVAGIGAWQLVEHRDTGTAGETVAVPQAPAGQSAGRYDTMGGVAEQMRDARLAESEAMGGVAESMRDARVTGGSPAAVTAPTVPVSRGNDRFTVYIVASDEEAARLRWSVADIIDPTTPAAADLMRFDVVVAASSEDELRIGQELDELDTIRNSLGLPGVRRIDLRQPPATAAGSAAPAAPTDGNLCGTKVDPTVC